jgi:hypothetical protein
MSKCSGVFRSEVYLIPAIDSDVSCRQQPAGIYQICHHKSGDPRLSLKAEFTTFPDAVPSRCTPKQAPVKKPSNSTKPCGR